MTHPKMERSDFPKAPEVQKMSGCRILPGAQFHKLVLMGSEGLTARCCGENDDQTGQDEGKRYLRYANNYKSVAQSQSKIPQTAYKSTYLNHQRPGEKKKRGRGRASELIIYLSSGGASDSQLGVASRAVTGQSE